MNGAPRTILEELAREKHVALVELKKKREKQTQVGLHLQSQVQAQSQEQVQAATHTSYTTVQVSPVLTSNRMNYCPCIIT